MPQPKRASRPRIDAIVNHIKRGSYDDEIGQIQEAINARNKDRQDAVLKTVREVFGKRASVVIDDGIEQVPVDELTAEQRVAAAKPKSRPRRARPGTPPPPQEDPALKAAEEAALAREKELEAEMAAEDTKDPEEGIESRSPIIGSMEPADD